MEKIIIKGLAFLVLSTFAVTSCKYDNEETLYPIDSCNTKDVSYKNDIEPVIKNNCAACHDSEGTYGNLKLHDYEAVKSIAGKPSFLGAIRHEKDFKAMPPSLIKLSDCNIRKIEAWVAKGAPDN